MGGIAGQNHPTGPVAVGNEGGGVPEPVAEVGHRRDDHHRQMVGEEKRELDHQIVLHRLLHGWLFIHAPLSLALLVMGAIHAVIALRY